jgi:hypothetical protein
LMEMATNANKSSWFSGYSYSHTKFKNYSDKLNFIIIVGLRLRSTLGIRSVVLISIFGVTTFPD